MIRISESGTMEKILYGVGVAAVIVNLILSDYQYRMKPRIHENLYRNVVNEADADEDGKTTRDEEKAVVTEMLNSWLDPSLEYCY